MIRFHCVRIYVYLCNIFLPNVAEIVRYYEETVSQIVVFDACPDIEWRKCAGTDEALG